MKQLLFFMFLLSAALLNKTAAQDSTIYTKDGAPLLVRSTGNNTLVELNHADSIFNFSIAVAKFPPGKKLDWHYHPGGTNSDHYRRRRLLPGKRETKKNSS